MAKSPIPTTLPQTSFRVKVPSREVSDSDMDVDTPPQTPMTIVNEREKWEAEVKLMLIQSKRTASPLPHDPINRVSLYSVSLDFCASSRWSKIGSICSTPEPTTVTFQGAKTARSRSRSPIQSFDLEGSEDDMFARTPEAPEIDAQPVIRGKADDMIDSEGYFIPQIGEVILNPSTGHTYTIINILGKGVFSCVVRARTLNGEEVALKIIRDKDLMIRAGLKEIRVLELLNQLDSEDHSYVIRFKSSFYLNRHLCIVSECLDLNLRDLVKKHANGLSLEALKSFGKQIMTSLTFFQKAKILHCDSNF